MWFIGVEVVVHPLLKKIQDPPLVCRRDHLKKLALPSLVTKEPTIHFNFEDDVCAFCFVLCFSLYMPKMMMIDQN